MLGPVSIKAIDLWFQVQHSPFWANLVCATLNFCSCTTLFFDLDDLVRIYRAWLCKEPKVSVLQVNASKVSVERKPGELRDRGVGNVDGGILF